jgi:hypothetical protein
MGSVDTFAWSPGFLTAHDIGYLLISNNSTIGVSHDAMIQKAGPREPYPPRAAYDSQGRLAGDTHSHPSCFLLPFLAQT